MGDPKKFKKKYSTSAHPWVKADIDLYKELKKEYGLKTRKEILIAQSFLKKYMGMAKRLTADHTEQAKKEEKTILEKLQKLGLLSAGANLADILSLKLKDILERRVQNILFKKGLAKTVNQARQFITHRHVAVGNKMITSPSSLITLEQESQLCFVPRSVLSNEDHPERINQAAEIKAEKEATMKKQPAEETTETEEVAAVKEVEEKSIEDEE